MNIRKLEFDSAEVYVLDDVNAFSVQDLKRSFAELPKWRQEKVLAFRHEKNRRESILSFHLLREVLSKEYGINEDLVFSYSEHGKPFILQHQSIHFNISHCEEAVACIVGDAEVGIDVECRGRYKKNVAQHVMNDAEMKFIKGHVDSDLAFTALWTQKEALLKMKGVGVSCNMRDVLDNQVQYDMATFYEAKYICSVAAIKKNSR